MTHQPATAIPRPHPRSFSHPRRIALFLTAWVAVSCVQGIAILGSNLAVSRGLAVLAYYAAMGLAWGFLALAVGRMIFALDLRRANVAWRVAGYVGALLACALVDTMVRRVGSSMLDGQSIL